MNRGESHPERLVGFEKMAQIRATVIRAGETCARRINRLKIRAIFFVGNVQGGVKIIVITPPTPLLS